MLILPTLTPISRDSPASVTAKTSRWLGPWPPHSLVILDLFSQSLVPACAEMPRSEQPKEDIGTHSTFGFFALAVSSILLVVPVLKEHRTC